MCTCPPPASATSAPVRSSANGAVVSPTGRRGSTSQKPPGSSVEKWTRSARAVGQRRRRSRPGSWPTCSRRARRRRADAAGRSANVACATSVSPFETSSRTSPRLAAPHLGRLVRLERRVERDRQRRALRAIQHGGHDTNSATRYRPLGWSDSISATSPGTTAVGQRTVGDVLARERVLVHLGAHVAGIDDEHAHVGMLGREHRRQLLERGLRRSVAAPSFVGLDRGVGRDVDDRAVRRGERRAAAAASARAARRR